MAEPNFGKGFVLSSDPEDRDFRLEDSIYVEKGGSIFQDSPFRGPKVFVLAYAREYAERKKAELKEQVELEDLHSGDNVEIATARVGADSAYAGVNRRKRERRKSYTSSRGVKIGRVRESCGRITGNLGNYL